MLIDHEVIAKLNLIFEFHITNYKKIASKTLEFSKFKFLLFFINFQKKIFFS